MYFMKSKENTRSEVWLINIIINNPYYDVYNLYEKTDFIKCME